MARLIIKRKSEWMNWTRSIGIYIDGQKVGTVSNGDAEEYTVSPGAHTVRARIDWCLSNEMQLTIAENETKTLSLGAYKYAGILLATELSLIALHIILKFTAGITFVFWFAIPFILVTLYYVTFGYNKYLLLKEDEFSLSF
jgi:hypothetical protein